MDLAALTELVSQGFEDALAQSSQHIDHPLTWVHEVGVSGRPRIVIDREWLTWAIERRNTSDVARFLGCSRPPVAAHLRLYNLREPSEAPFIITRNPRNPRELLHEQVYSVSGFVSGWSDGELDNVICHLRVHYPRAGIVMLHGHIQAMGQNVPRERVRLSLRRVDPNHRLFQRTIIDRRQYWVPGPNYLWHHDGQHGEFCTNMPLNPSKFSMMLTTRTGIRSDSLWYPNHWNN